MVKQYIGARYVPILDGEYNPEKAYEPLTIVTYQYNSYTSKKAVPAGILPTDEEYWALTGNFNAQLNEIMEKLNGSSLIYDQAENNGDFEVEEEEIAVHSEYSYTELKGLRILSDNHKNNRIRIVTSNNPVQNYLYDSSHEMNMDLLESYFDFYNSMGADLIGIQELSQLPYDKITDLIKSGAIVDTYASNVFTPGSTYYSSNTWRLYSPAIYSALNMIGEENHIYSSSGTDEQRMFVKGVVTIFGKSISLYNTHLTHVSSEIRMEQLVELMTYIANDTSDIIIVTGDFNMDYASEPESFYPLTSGGFVAMNTSLPTYPRDNAVSIIDNVFVKGSVTKVSEGTISNVPSGLEAIDHRAYYVDIQI